jgi:hypothetical protein
MAVVLGVQSSRYPPPESDDLSEADLPFVGACAWPPSLGALAALLCCQLPAEVRVQVGKILATSNSGNEANYLHVAAGELLRLQEQYPILAAEISGMVCVDKRAPMRGILERVEDLVQKWNPEPQDTRRQSDQKLDSYLEVWDLREGWERGQYDAKMEHRLRDIAMRLGVPVPTVQNRYKSAYRLIVGQDYEPTVYLIIFGPGKLGARLQRWRKPKSRTDRAGAETISGAEALASTGASNQEYLELVVELKEMVEKRCDPEEIAVALNLPGERVSEIVNWVKDRGVDGLL